jgi:hypothetical protein
VDRDSSIEVTFSAPVDSDTVTAETFQLIGPDGAVAGELETDGATVSFTPERALAILADYQLNLSAPLAAVTGDELQGDVRRAFRTREGVFGQPKRLGTGSAANLFATGSGSGYVQVSWTDSQVPPSKIVVFLDPRTGSWSAPGPSEMHTDGDYGRGCVALNEKGDAFALLGSTDAVWNRAVQGRWGTAKPAPAVYEPACALADDGTAMAIWEDIVGNDQTVFAASLSPEGEWSVAKPLRSKARVGTISTYGAGFLATYRLDEGGMESSEYHPQLGWLAAKPITEPGVSNNYWSFVALSPAALMTWNGPNASVYVSTFDGNSWSPLELGRGQGGTRVSISSHGRLAAWLNQQAAYIVRGDPDGTWRDPLKLGTANSEAPLAASIDSSGNALAAWPNGSAIEWRRSVQGSSEWSDMEQIPDQDPAGVFSTIDHAGQVTLVWKNSLGVWASRFE